MNSLVLRTLFKGIELAGEINKSPKYVSQRLNGHGTWTDGDMYLIDKAVAEKKKILDEETKIGKVVTGKYDWRKHC